MVWKIAFWNAAGFLNKAREFWEEFKRWDVVLEETWVEEREWEKVEKKYQGGPCGKCRKQERKTRKEEQWEEC